MFFIGKVGEVDLTQFNLKMMYSDHHVVLNSCVLIANIKCDIWK